MATSDRIWSIEEALVSRSLVLRSTDASGTTFLLSFHDLMTSDYCHEHAKDRENPHDVILRNTVDNRPEQLGRTGPGAGA